jgi:hypothetical protein
MTALDNMDFSYPDFFVIGAGKSGTTTLYGLMRQHPDIFLPDQKETHFFYCDGQPPNFADTGAMRMNETAVFDRKAYESLYRGKSGLKGEICPTYLLGEHVAERIFARRPDAKIIAILRDPVERTFSAYRFMKARGSETGSFDEALDAEAEHIRDNWQPMAHYTRGSFYYAQLKPYYDFFSSDQILVVEFERFSRTPVVVTNEILAFLGQRPLEQGTSVAQTNKTVIIENPLLASMLVQNRKGFQMLRRMFPKKYRARMKEWLLSKLATNEEKMSEETRARLKALFAEDAQMTRELTGQRFENWSV